MKTLACLSSIAVAAVVAATPLAAQEVATAPDATVENQSFGGRSLNDFDPNKQFVLRYDVRLGGLTRPAYFGSDEYVVAPDFALNFDYARLRGFGEYGSLEEDRPRALGFRGSIRFIGGRSSDDFDELEGLDDIDPALELGFGVFRRERNYLIYGDLRYGVTGHNGFVGELGADAITYPGERWQLRVGPRMVFGNSSFADTYFGVSDDEAADSGLAAFDADGGLLGAGIEAVARYRFNDLWGIEAAVRADRLLNSAADSPITDMGSEDQIRFRVGITRELVLQF